MGVHSMDERWKSEGALVPRFSIRALTALFLALLVLASSTSAFDSPLSDTAVREAYFLGQRHDGSLARLLEKYTKHLQPPKLGPHISSISFFTPFAQLAVFSDRFIGNYSAQQAQLDHRRQQEFVKILVRIQLTASYGAFVNDPAQTGKHSPPLLIRRSYDFWKDFRVQVSSGNQPLEPSTSRGKPDVICGRGGSCTLTGATLELEFPASLFASDSATIQVTPPEGDQVSADFDPSRIR